MSIVTVEVESIHGAAGGNRIVFYRGQDSQGKWHSYGPVITHDASFNPDALLTSVGVKLGDMLAEQEATRVLSE